MVKKRGDIDEQRLYKRFYVERLSLTASLASCTATIQNISSGGACVLVEKHMGIGKKFVINLTFQGRTAPIAAQVSWSRLSALRKNSRGEVVPCYLTGIEFIEPLERHGIDVAEVIGTSVTYDD